MIAIESSSTPNPNTRKYGWGAKLGDHAPLEVASEREARRSPLARRIFGVNGVVAVFVGTDFVSVRKHEGVSWEPVEAGVRKALQEFAAAGEAAVLPEEARERGADDEVVQRIKSVLDRDIRPAVAMDGGDIVLVGFVEGVVTLELRGACHGCPSSTATLKMGVERRLMAMVPEVSEVIAVNG